MSDLLDALVEEYTVISSPKLGKAYANRKPETDRPTGDFYPTPRSLVWEIKDVILDEFYQHEVTLEPASGEGVLVEELNKLGYLTYANDLYRGGLDYLTTNRFNGYSQVFTNPPFSLWDSFVRKSKSHAERIMMIGRLNYLGTNSRSKDDTWKNLKSIYVFNRYVDYQTPSRTDGLFHVGAMATGWFLWDMSYSGDPTVHIVDVQKYAKLGGYKT